MNACVCASELGGFYDFSLRVSGFDHRLSYSPASQAYFARARILRAPKREEGGKYASFCEYNNYYNNYSRNIISHVILLFSRDCHMIAITLSPEKNESVLWRLVFSSSLCDVFLRPSNIGKYLVLPASLFCSGW